MKAILVLGIALIAVNGTVHAATQEHDMAQHQMAMQASASHAGFGVLKAVNTTAGKVQIAHGPIVDLEWPAMTMWFALRDPLPQDIKIGDAVRFELMQGEQKQWMILKIVKR